MAFEKILLCDSCGNQINDTESDIPNGFAFVGNVHVADPEQENGAGGGLIGNNLKKISSYTTVANTTHMCVKCAFEVMIGHGYEVEISKRNTDL